MSRQQHLGPARRIETLAGMGPVAVGSAVEQPMPFSAIRFIGESATNSPTMFRVLRRAIGFEPKRRVPLRVSCRCENQ